jgi:hypothetical protein
MRLGNDDFDLASEQLYRTHSRMYMRTGICRSAGFLLDRCQRRGASAEAISSAERSPSDISKFVGIGSLLKHLNAHVVDHLMMSST